MEWRRKWKERHERGGGEDRAQDPARRSRSLIDTVFGPIDRALATVFGKTKARQVDESKKNRQARAAAELGKEKRDLERRIAELKAKSATLNNDEEPGQQDAGRKVRGFKSKRKNFNPTFTPSPNLPALNGYSGMSSAQIPHVTPITCCMKLLLLMSGLGAGFAQIAFEGTRQDAGLYDDGVFRPIHASSLLPSSLLADVFTAHRECAPSEELHGATSLYFNGKSNPLS